MTSRQRIQELAGYARTYGLTETAEHFGCSPATVERAVRYAKAEQMPPKLLNKKVPSFDWREWTEHLKERQELSEKASASQMSAKVSVETPFRYIVFKPLADLHLGSLGVNFDRFVEVTDDLLACPYLYFALLGDEQDNFVSFKNQLPMLKQILSPTEQDAFLESWLNEVQHKMLFATWGNHGAFEEKVSGRNTAKRILSKNVVYFNGIGVCDLKINDQEYQIVATHTTRFNSSFNKTHGLKQLARRDLPSADVYLAGHIHDPAYEVSFERGKDQVFMVLGSLKEHDSHSQRYFSYFSATRDGAIVFDSSTKRVIPFPCLQDALEFAEGANKEVSVAAEER